ncbi:multifunctional 2-keto-3-deoxygluconate 6-phosphate aldolase and 2-keto-4-hydroxyglutarate aldolase and oxaloacetate decarboxylase [Luteimonas sp. 9C]|uniref:bifunctional 4-hydroxy-2-oxoglutarate aldolase/2-dehydro-3-deoxy-phosphogluconate aldolase n=1 Tax=Luteimonas sp. 9C TaxID=2653148 RepID=UPI0012F21764|nr:bifunctional 4-hydroxy-2-oxoglutarate aldolase/2-dehydro-3-deoxy-phosphogluconate aldolase [Luteimonas sp. 9C]VXB60405.1 multifunctional 2-keto-3-deoxygluconate 6-phosphate aldolase and 2-keto-4-hydroxyglutarate aldolase and oxaloacetate decarboxylase [Luteimonas sp. 9C]
MATASTMSERQQRAAELLRAAGVLPVITVHALDEARAIADALLEGGLHTLELTLRTPVAIDALAMLKRERPDIVIGAGTVLDADHIRASIDAGADFLVTPGTPPALADALAEADIPVVPGAATPTEFMALRARGFRNCKLFPASAVGGLAMLKGLAGPLHDMRFCPTGGISESNAAEFLAQPNVLCIGGSWMLDKGWLDAGDYGRVRETAARAAQIVRDARG